MTRLSTTLPSFFLLLFALALHTLAQEKAPSKSSETQVAAEMAKAATLFLSTLDDATRATVQLAYEDPARRDWHNIPKPWRKGLSLREMSGPQKQACLALVETAMSPSGFRKAKQVMQLETNIREGEKDLVNGAIRDPERYYLTIFGRPAERGEWGWSFEGHHFSLNIAIRDQVIIGDTPSFLGANPATVRINVEGGPAVGSRTLVDEEQIAFDLLQTLSPEQHLSALIASKPPNEYQNPGSPTPPQLPTEGLPASKMTPEQKALLKKLLATYCGNFTNSIAERRMRDLQDADWDRLHFAWAGASEPGQGHYYRVSGPSLLLEFVNVQADPAGNPANHIHTIWRNLRHDFGGLN